MNIFYNLILAPIYFAVIYFLVAPIFAKRWTTKYNRKYFYWALAFKLMGAVAFCGIYQFYYKYGDTISYYNAGKAIVQAFLDSPYTGFQVLNYSSLENSKIYSNTFQYISATNYYRNESTWLMSKLSGVGQLVSLGSYYATSMLFGLWSFLGTWKLYQFFYERYPRVHFWLAFGVLFIPACIFWSSGVVKEAITTGGIGFITYYFDQIALRRKHRLSYYLITGFSIYLVITIKAATLYTFVPALLLLLFARTYKKLPSFLRFMSSLFLVLSAPVFLWLGSQEIVKALEENESFKQAQVTIGGFQSDHGSRSEGHGGGQASTYHLSTAGDTSPTGLLASIPEAVSFTLFRPFPWEASKAVQLLGALESFATLLITLFILLKLRLVLVFKYLRSDPVLLLCISYTILFGFIAGYISFNYGVLQRFKTPIMPFYGAFLVILYYYTLPKLKRKKVRRRRPVPRKVML